MQMNTTMRKQVRGGLAAQMKPALDSGDYKDMPEGPHELNGAPPLPTFKFIMRCSFSDSSCGRLGLWQAIASLAGNHSSATVLVCQ